MDKLKHFSLTRLNMDIIKFGTLIFSLMLILPGYIVAQPSGGPYGPVQQRYEIPKVTGTVYYVSTEGRTESPGTSFDAPTSIETAFRSVKTGDAIVLRGGTYRTGNLIFNQGITILPYQDEQVVFKGTLIPAEWQDLGNGLWRTKWEKLFPMEPQSWWRKEREGHKTPLHRFNNDMVFVEGKFLQSAGWQGELTEDSYYIDYKDKMVYIGTNPTGKLVEITAYDNAMIRTTKEVNGKKPDKTGPVIRGITFTQYAYRALEVEGYFPEGVTDESKYGKDVVGTTIEDCSITFCSRVAAYLYGDKLTLRRCKISDTSTEGIYIMSSNDVLLEKNIFMRNNIEGITGYFPSAVKIFNQCHRVVCNDNLVTDLPLSNGIWYDVGNVDGVFTNNWVENVGYLTGNFTPNTPWPAQNGFFFEISKGAVVTGNVFYNCQYGLFSLNSDSVKVYNNTFVNSTVAFGRDQRSAESDHFGWHPQTGPGVDERTGHEFGNNLMFGDENFKRPLLFIWQPAAMCEQLTEPAMQVLDHNVYVLKGNTKPAIWLCQNLEGNCQNAFNTTAGLNKAKPGYETNGQSFTNYRYPVFKGEHLKNFQIESSFAAVRAGGAIPPYIKSFMPNPKAKPYVGAYVPVIPKK